MQSMLAFNPGPAMTGLLSIPSATMQFPDLESLPPDHPLLAALVSAQNYAQGARSASTRKGYNSDWRDFEAWCHLTGLLALPAPALTISLYLATRADEGLKVWTLSRRLTAISAAHKSAGYPSPCSTKNNPVLSETWRGIRRKLGIAQEGKKALTIDWLKVLIAATDETLKGSRDRALYLVGFAGAFRASELAGVSVERLEWHGDGDGVTIHIPTSKTDQEGKGREVELVRGAQPGSTSACESTCPVRALRRWLDDASITSGPIFRKVTRYNTVSQQGLHKASIRIILKKALRQAGMDEGAIEDYGAHSLRAGFVTAAHRNGARLTEIAEQTGHKTLSMVCRYIRDDDAAQSAVRKLGM